MKRAETNPDKELYRRLREFSSERLWAEEVPKFDQAAPQERLERVALLRAVGVVLAESGTAQQKQQAKDWLCGLLKDPCEKIRRYAVAALPKLGAGPREEAELLSLLRTTTVEREKKFVTRALEKIGGTATLQLIRERGWDGLQQAEQKVQANLARRENPSALRLDSVLSEIHHLKIHLRGRDGLEQLMRGEVEEHARVHRKFRMVEAGRGLVTIAPTAPLALGDIYRLRCFGSAGFVLGLVSGSEPASSIEALAAVITSPVSRRIFETFTAGPVRYRLEFSGRGRQRRAVRLLADRVYSLCPEILNDPRQASWVISIHPAKQGQLVELCPRLVPDPRFYYRRADIPAASHPPLAACLARLAGRVDGDIVWDPFCGSGLELIERALLGGVHRLFGTDRSAEALAVARDNLAAAGLNEIRAQFASCDFREFRKVGGLGPNAATLIITNPPLGKRVPVPDLNRLMADFFSVSAVVLRPGGRVVLVNPLRMESAPRTLRLEFRQAVDLGGFVCRLEMYRKQPRHDRDRK
jgi:predicted RNA methylase